MKNLKRNSGISLIVLVITIIILIILAGVSVSTLTGNKGIINNTTDAVEKSAISQEKEQLNIAYNAVLIDKTKNKDYGDVTGEEIDAELQLEGIKARAVGNNPITVTFDSGRVYYINNKGSISRK